MANRKPSAGSGIGGSTTTSKTAGTGRTVKADTAIPKTTGTGGSPKATSKTTGTGRTQKTATQTDGAEQSRPAPPEAPESIANLSNRQVSEIVQQNRSLKRGSKSASLADTMTATNDDIKHILSNVLYWYDRPLVKSDEECAERLNEYFTRLNQTGEIPTVEKMCLALGTVRSEVWEWEQGKKGPVRAYMIKKAKEILAALDAELVSKGKIPQVTYIFRAKNFFGMRDQQDVVITPNSPLGDTKPADVIAAEYEQLPDD